MSGGGARGLDCCGLCGVRDVVMVWPGSWAIFAGPCLLGVCIVLQRPRSLRGPRGSRGSRGPRGSRGSRGLRGPRVHCRVRGVRGVPGVRGVRGVRGSAGSAGSRGLRGQHRFVHFCGRSVSIIFGRKIFHGALGIQR